MLELIVLLLMAHAVADYALQSDTMGICKNPLLKERTEPEVQPFIKLQKKIPWYYWMFNHSLIHGLAVWFVTGNIFLAIFETFTHFFIDLGKCAGAYGIHVDQSLHVLCKLFWAWWIVQTLGVSNVASLL